MRLGTAHDFNLVRRTSLLAAVVLVAAWLVERSTEERASGAPSVGLLPLVPVAAAIAVAFVLRRARRQGETTALLALGATPWTACRGAVWAALAFSMVAGAAFATGHGDEAALFPEPTAAFDVFVARRDGRDVFRSQALGIEVSDREGQWSVSPHRDLPPADAQSPRPAGSAPAVSSTIKRRRWLVGLTLAVSGPVLAALSISPPRMLITAVVVTVYAVVQVVSFQLVGLHRVPPEVLLAPIGLLGGCWWAMRTMRAW